MQCTPMYSSFVSCACREYWEVAWSDRQCKPSAKQPAWCSNEPPQRNSSVLAVQTTADSPYIAATYAHTCKVYAPDAALHVISVSPMQPVPCMVSKPYRPTCQRPSPAAGTPPCCIRSACSHAAAASPAAPGALPGSRAVGDIAAASTACQEGSAGGPTAAGLPDRAWRGPGGGWAG